MELLNMQDIYDLCILLKNEDYDLKTLPIYLGNDEELNGVHAAYYCETFEKGKANYEDIAEIIEFSLSSSEVKDKGILIS